MTDAKAPCSQGVQISGTIVECSGQRFADANTDLCISQATGHKYSQLAGKRIGDASNRARIWGDG